MQLHEGRAVLQGVLGADRLARQLTRLAGRGEGRAQLQGEGDAKDEAAGLDADHGVDAAGAVAVGQEGDRMAHGDGVLEQRGDVLEYDSRGGEVGNVADQRFEVHGRGPPEGRGDYTRGGWWGLLRRGW